LKENILCLYLNNGLDLNFFIAFDYANDAAKFMTNVKPLDHLHLSPNVE